MAPDIYRMPQGIPGAPTRESTTTIEPYPVADDAVVGRMGTFDSGVFRTINDGDPEDPEVPDDDILNVEGVAQGILVRSYPTRGGTHGDVLTRGYIAVANVSGTPAANAKVYITTAGAFSAKAAGNVLINATFQSAADEYGNVEIAYKV